MRHEILSFSPVIQYVLEQKRESFELNNGKDILNCTFEANMRGIWRFRFGFLAPLLTMT